MPARSKSRSIIGRPTRFSPEWAEAFCQEIAEASYIAKIAKRADQPARWTIYRWLNDDPDFCDMYARAREERADAIFEECIELADQPIKDVVEAGHRRVQIEARNGAVEKE